MNFFQKNFFKAKIVVCVLQISSILFLFGWIPISNAEAPTIREHQLKAVFLYRFAHFITWPSNAFKSPRAPFRICLWGDEDPFHGQLHLAVANEKIRGRLIQVQRITSIDDMVTCQIVYADESKHRYKTNLFMFVKDYPILTVSDMENFAVRGGMIEFFNLGNKVRFTMAPKNIRNASLSASARLLQIAKIVK
jgi:hypothetical protein